MNTEPLPSPPVGARTVAQWKALLRDEAALLDRPGYHHKALLAHAYALHRDQIIDQDVLSDMLEQADSALAYAVEALFDGQSGE